MTRPGTPAWRPHSTRLGDEQTVLLDRFDRQRPIPDGVERDRHPVRLDRRYETSAERRVSDPVVDRVWDRVVGRVSPLGHEPGETPLACAARRFIGLTEV